MECNSTHNNPAHNMFFIVSNCLILFIFALGSDPVSAASILFSEENDLEFNFVNNNELENFYERPFLFPAINPSISEDARLETVWIHLFSRKRFAPLQYF